MDITSIITASSSGVHGGRLEAVAGRLSAADDVEEEEEEEDEGASSCDIIRVVRATGSSKGAVVVVVVVVGVDKRLEEEEEEEVADSTRAVAELAGIGTRFDKFQFHRFLTASRGRPGK